jgi:hypothetical protein
MTKEDLTVMNDQNRDFEIVPLRMWNKGRHAFEKKMHPNTHLRGRPKKQLPRA